MAMYAPKTILFHTLICLLLTMASQSKASFNSNYYHQTCPQAEKIILQTVYNASMHDPKVPARILRMFFHDCFIRGCDASLLLDSTPGNQAEKDGPPNISVRSFYVIDDAKAKLEMACPRTVSCADIIGIAARDVVTMSGGPYWNVLKGRKDGRVSRANETINLPAPTFNVSQLIQSFVRRGLGVKELVALSGGHTLGFSHCSSFESRLRNFTSLHDVDPSMNNEFAQKLRKKCPKPNRDRTAGELLDSTSSTFDNDYYKQVVAGKGVFGSDQALFSDYRTRWIVESFAEDQSLFFKEFAASMVKLGNVGVIEDGEVRLNCRLVN
ncbi:Peroxidase superfamily protein [Prunus dulcis]|uniref:Peroxidase n=2 Tax=Prunus dulcis TaxID=3755 RepID=A0A5E4E8I7_PRUDU|nr:peroxidase 66 [Prunus dulcis]BBN69797.1 Peroxidase superfamily protein [Prunus dulcis]VVA11031.1 PREDICTED: peroxidase [Prunus dulcis]